MKLTIEAQGGASPEVVWDRYVHPGRWHEWSPQIRSVDCTDDTIAGGTTGTVHGPCGIGVDFEILDVDVEKQCWSWRVVAVGIRLTLGHGVDAGPGESGCRTTLTIDGPPPVVVGYAPLARVALSRLVR